MASYLLAFYEVVSRIEGRLRHNLLDTHYCRLQESRAEAKGEAMKVLTDLTQRVSAGLATGEQHYEIGINTEPLFACQDWLPLGNGSASRGKDRRSAANLQP